MRTPIFILFLFFSFGAFAQTDSIPDFYNKGKKAYRSGDYKAAEDWFLKNLEFQQKEGKTEDLIKAHIKIGDIYRKMRKLDIAETGYENAMNLAEKDNKKYEAYYIAAAEKRGFVFSKKYQPLKAVKEYEKLLPRAEKLHGKESDEYANLLMNMGIDYYKSGDYFLSEEYFLKSLAIIEKVSEPDSEEFNRIYSNLGGNYRKAGDYPKALEYGEKALRYKLKNYPPDHPSVAKYHMNIGKALLNMEQPGKAKPYMDKAVEILKKHFPETHPDVAGTMCEAAGAYADLGDIETAISYYETMFRVDTNLMANNHPYVLGSYFNIAWTLKDAGEYDRALEMYKTGLRLLETRDYVPETKRVEFLVAIAKTHLKKGENKDAEKIAIDALQRIAEDFRPKSKNDIPTYDQVKEKRTFIDLTGFLSGIYEKSGELRESAAFAEKAIEGIKKMRKNFHTDGARRFLNSETSGFFKTGVRVNFKLYQKTNERRYLEKSFQFSEDAKANILKHSVNEGLALKSAGIPQNILDSLDNLKFKIGGSEDDLNDYLSEKKPTFVVDSVKQVLFELKTNYTGLLRMIEKNHPKYFRLKFGNNDASISEIQQKVKAENALMLSFFYDEQNIYGFLISEEEIFSFETKHLNQLPFKIAEFRKYLTPEKALSMSEQDIKDFSKINNELYQLLIKPIIEKIELTQKKSLLIIPHGVLHYLPFEILKPASENDFLVKKLPIYYALSSGLWAKGLENKTVSKKTFSGFAPKYDSRKGNGNERSGFSSLNWNIGEVEVANSFFNGQIFTGEAASEEKFRFEAPKSGILHLAMHADVNDQNPMRSGLVFTPGADSVENGFLNLYEVYNLEIPAETIVMNACNTGYGKLAEGEGVLSLSNAFSYAGCRSILLNLWLADDQASSEIITSFYKYLKEGNSKDSALRKAKLAYLESADPLRAHPYFWAGLVLQGEPGNKNTNYQLWWIIGILALIPFYYFFRKQTGKLFPQPQDSY